jgi:dihydrolipoamide dehydrogenase
MKDYDLIVIGSGSAMNLVDPFLSSKPGAKVAVIDKDEPGGICLTRGCIPTKLLVAVADVVRHVQTAHEFGIDVDLKTVDFARVMKRMRDHIDPDIESIRRGLKESPGLDYYDKPARFIAPKTLQVGGQQIRAPTILLCTGSKPWIPKVEGLDKVPYHTTDTILRITTKPASLVIVGGGYIAAEFGHFFSAMGTQVTILGRNPRFLPDEEPEVGRLAKEQLGERLRIETGVEVVRVEPNGTDGVRVHGRRGAATIRVDASTFLFAAGRASNSDVLDPAKGGVKTDPQGWIQVDEYLQTSAPGVWALGDANGVHMFKHKANYESLVVWHNAFGGHRMKVDYHAVPRAVFTDPEVAAVGMGEEAAIKEHGKANLRIGYYRYEDTAKGQAIGAKDHFVKVIAHAKDLRVVGAHLVGPHASILIHEIIPLMNVAGGNAQTVRATIHIHPALSEVVERAFGAFTSVDEYHTMLRESGRE